MTRQTAAVRKQILDAYYIFKKDSELKKLIQEKLPEKYSSVFTLRNLLTDMEKFIHKNILFDEAIIIRDYNLEEVDGFDASEEMKTSSNLPPSSDLTKNNREAKKIRLECIVQRIKQNQ